MNKAVLKRIRQLEKVYTPQKQERIFVVFSWPTKGEPSYEEAIESSVKQLRRGDRVIVVPEDGVKELERRGISSARAKI
jgi:hypothetical protein